MKIETHEKTITIHTVGGQDFVSRAEAVRHLAELNKELGFGYYIIRTGFDGTEGRGYFHEQIVGIRQDQWGSVATGAIIAYCLEHFGAPVMEWYGRPIDVWKISELKRFDVVESLHAWVDSNKRHKSAPPIKIRFEGPILCDEYGKELGR